jgi:uncharacterized repeat protein (TIGR01451 family)
MVPSLNRQVFRLHWQLFTNMRVTAARFSRTLQSGQSVLIFHQHLGWLTGSAILLFAALSSPVAAQTVIVDEEFKDPTSFGWQVGTSNTNSIQPCLTAGTTATPATSIPACNPQKPINPSGSGALRLTTNDINQATFAFYNYTIPANNGLVITFNFFSYGGTRQLFGSNADGITFFLFNGTTPNAQAQPGAFGGSLGYAQKSPPNTPPQPGLTNAYVGVGLDEFGNFANSNEGRGSGSPVPGNCDGYPVAAPDRVSDSVTVRGSGSGQAGYCYLTNSGPLVPLNNPENPNGIDNPNVPATGPRETALRTARIRLTPNYVLTVEIDFGNGFQTVIPPTNLNSFTDQGAPPPSFKFGFAAATGDATNIHEIRNLVIRTITNASAPDLTIQKQPSTDTFLAGETGEYTLTVTNVGQGPTYGPVTVTDTLPPGFSLASATGTGWECSESSARRVTCVYSGNLRSNNPATDPVISPGESQSVVLRVNVPNTPNEYTNTATVTTTADNNRRNNQTQAKVRVSGIVVPSKAAQLIDANNNGLAEPGEAITYTITLQNISQTPSSETLFTDQIPAGTTYIPGTTTLNGTAVPDAAGNIMPFSGNGALVNSTGAPPGQIAAQQTATVQFQVRIKNPPGVTEIRNIGRVSGPQLPPTPTPTPPTVVPLGPVGQPRLRLVKRITRVNQTAYTDVVDDPNDANDDPSVWPVGLQPTGLANLSAQSPVQSGDEVEYTVYFLSDGAQASQSIQVCDPIPAQTTFDPNGFGAGNGIVLNQNQAPTNLTNASDTDAGTFFSPLTPVTAPCPDTNNPNGAVVVRVGDIPTTPVNNAGFVRFRVKID